MSRMHKKPQVQNLRFFLEGVPASCLAGVEYEKVVGLAVLYGYTRLDCEGHEQSVNALSSQG